MSDADKSLTVLAKGAALVFFGMFISKFLTYIYRIIIARMGTADYGLLSLGIAYFGFVSLFSFFGMQIGMVKFVSLYRSTNERLKLVGTFVSVVSFQLVLSIILASLGYVFANEISVYIFHDPALAGILRILSVAVPFSVLAVSFLSVANAFEKAQYDVIARSFVETFIKLAGTVVLVYLGFGVIGAAYAYSGAAIVAFFVAFYFLLKVLKEYRVKWKTYGRFKEVFNYSWPLLLSGFMMFVYLWTDTFMLGYFKDASTVGIYNVALPTANLLYMFPFGLMTLFIPVITSLVVNKEENDFKVVYQSTSKWIMLVNSLIFVMLIFFGKEIIGVLFGVDYVSGYTALVILSIGYFIAYSMHNSAQLLLIYKKTKLMFVNTLVSGILNIFLNYILIPEYGLVGAGIATSASYCLMAVLMAVQVYSLTKVFPFKLSYFKILFSALLCGVIGLVLLSFFEMNIIFLLILLAFVSILYLLFLIIFKAFDIHDRIVLRAVQERVGLRLGFLEKFFRRFG